MIIREVTIEDARDFLELIKEVESNAEFMLMENAERKTTPEQQEKQLRHFENQDNSTIFVAEDQKRLVGYLIVIGGTVKRNKHTGQIVIGILKDFRGRGVGSALFNKVTIWSKDHGVSRLELTVVTENIAGVELYKKFGFEIEGTKRRSLIIDDKTFDEYYMAKLM